MHLIAAVDSRFGLGRNNELLAHLSADLQRFKQLTLGRTVIYGRRTLETFPKARPLSGRSNIILSTQQDYHCEGAQVAHSLPQLASLVRGIPHDELWVIGGASVYEQLLPYCSWAHLTLIDADLGADCFLRDLRSMSRWREVGRGMPMHEKGLNFCYHDYFCSSALLLGSAAEK